MINPTGKTIAEIVRIRPGALWTIQSQHCSRGREGCRKFSILEVISMERVGKMVIGQDKKGIGCFRSYLLGLEPWGSICRERESTTKRDQASAHE
jgi:hypothetical protein